MKSRHLMLALLVVFCAAGDSAEDELVYRSYDAPQSLPATELAHLRRLAGKGGRVMNDIESGRLMVIATTNAHLKVAMRLARASAMADQNVRIDVTIKRTGGSSRSVTQIDPSGTVVFRPGGAPARSPRLQATLHKQGHGTDLIRQSGRDSSISRQSITVLNNHEGAIFVGTEVIFLNWLLEYAIQHELVPPEFTMRNVGARLVVTPSISKSGEIITLTVTPELTGLIGFARERIRYTGVSTVVKVRNGATLHLGGSGDAKEFYDKFLIGVDKNGTRQKTDITVTPIIINASGRAAKR